MNTILQIYTESFKSIQPLLKSIVPAMLKLLGALAILLIGWLVLKIVTKALTKLLKISKIDVLSTKLNDADIFGNPNMKIDLSTVIIKFVRWIIMLILAIAASEQLGLTMISEQISNLLNYLPQLLSALAMLVVGLYIASLVKKAIQSFLKSMDVSGGNLLGNIAFMVIAIMVSVTALNQAGINTDIITSNLTLIFGSVLLAFSVAFGLGSRDIIKRLLFGFYSRKNLEIGKHIKFKNIEGTILAIDNIAMKIKTTNGTIVVPIKKIVDATVEIS